MRPAAESAAERILGAEQAGCGRRQIGSAYRVLLLMELEFVAIEVHLLGAAVDSRRCHRTRVGAVAW